MRKVEIDWEGLTDAFESDFWNTRFYLDLNSGETLAITDEVFYYLDSPSEKEPPDWMQKDLETARVILEEIGESVGGANMRYIEIPGTNSAEAYRDMQRFIGTVQLPRLQDRLWRAIEGRGAFRHFRDVLGEYEAEWERWEAFKANRIRERIMNWLAIEGIEPTNPLDPLEIPESELEEAFQNEKVIEELTLLLLHLTSWDERVFKDYVIRRAWKGYPFEALNTLEEKGFISQSRRAKSVTLTEDGIRQAKQIAEKYRVDKT